MRQVTVQFLKKPDHLHWGFEVHVLGVDDWGHWMAAPVGTRRWKGREEVGPSTDPAVFCFPHEGWWHLHYNGPTTRYSHFVDIVTQPVWVSSDRYEMVDLDLDVVRHQDGTVEVEDEDEFLAHQVRYRYSEEMVVRARAETALITEALLELREPFDRVAAAWLSKVETGVVG